MRVDCVRFVLTAVIVCINSRFTDYAKLIRKRDKQPDGKPVQIDMETLRASTAQARGAGINLEDTTPPPESSSQAGYNRQDREEDVEEDGKVYNQPASPPPPTSLPSMIVNEAMPPAWSSRGPTGYVDHGFNRNRPSR
jgi:hypothetical protein